MVNVIVGRKRTIQVSSNTTAGIIDSTSPVTIKNIAGAAGVTRLDRLSDVDASGESTGSTLIYDAETDKYIVRKIEFNDVTGDLDGGTF